MFKRTHRSASFPASSPRQESATIPDAPTPHEVIRLQRLIGNRATMRLLKIQRADIELDDILDPQQVASAIAYYKLYPARYSKSVINQIQQAVGTPQKDAMDAADVQAVAKWQKDHGSEFEPNLKLDGKAGPRTLPRMFGSGLAPSKNISQYVGEMKAIFDQWDTTLKTPEARRLALEAEINKHLTSIGVPVVELVRSDGNHFNNIPWIIEIRPTAFEDMPTDPEERERRPTAITATLYHEARHAEQDFRIAAMLAGRGWSEDKIFANTGNGTKKAVIQEAMKKENQLKPGTMEAAIAEGWFDSIYGADSEKRRRIFAEKDEATAEANAAADVFQANPTPENKRKLAVAVKRMDRAVDAYKDLPEENDAFRIGNEVIAKFQALLKTK